MTLKELRDDYIAYKAERVKLSSISVICSMMDNHLVPYFTGDISKGINSEELNRFIEYKLRSGASLRTCKELKARLHNVLKFANLKYGIPLCSWNIEWPSRNIQVQKKIKYFSKDECKKVFNYMEQSPDPRLLGMVIGLTTGMRIGEICGLKFSDIDFTNKTIHVQRTLERITLHSVSEIGSDKKTMIVVNTPKTASSDRYCPVAKLPLKWLKRYREVSSPDSYVLTLKAHPTEPRTYRSYYYSTLELLGLPRLNPHCMRHTFATQMLHNKVDVVTIASVLGHSSPSITLEVYSHTNEEAKAKAVNGVFGKMF